MSRHSPALLVAAVVMAWASIGAGTALAFTGSLDSRLAAKPDLMDEFESSDEFSTEFIGHNRG